MSSARWRRPFSSRAGSRTPIGVDFAPDRVSWVQLEKANGGLRVIDACSIPHAEDLEDLFRDSSVVLSEMARTIKRKARFKGRQIVTQAPTQDLRLMVLNYSAKSGENEERQILELARERMQDDLSTHVVDYVPIRTSGDRQGDRSAMVAVVPEAPVIERLEGLRRVGFEVVALEIAPVAVRRLIVGGLTAHRIGQPGEVALVVRMQEHKTELTVVSGRRLLLYREIEVGRDSIVAAIGKRLDCDLDAARDLMSSFGVGEYEGDGASALAFEGDREGFEESAGMANSLREIARPELRALTEQAHKAISYAAFQTHGKTIDVVHLMQSGAECPGLGGLLSELLQLPVRPIDPNAWIEPPRQGGMDALDSGMHLALGFALRGAVDE